MLFRSLQGLMSGSILTRKAWSKLKSRDAYPTEPSRPPDAPKHLIGGGLGISGIPLAEFRSPNSSGRYFGETNMAAPLSVPPLLRTSYIPEVTGFRDGCKFS